MIAVPSVPPPLNAAAGVVPFEPDAQQRPDAGGADAFAGALGQALDHTSTALDRADRAESAFRSGRAGLQEMVVERAQADITLAIAAATASRLTQSLSTLLNMQV